MSRLRRLQSAPDPVLREQWNQLVRLIEQLLKLSADAPLELDLMSDSPHLRLGIEVPRPTERAKLLETLILGGTANAVLLRKNQEENRWEETEEEIEITDWALRHAVEAGRRVLVDYHQQSDEWHIVASERAPIYPLVQVCCDANELVSCFQEFYVEGSTTEGDCECGDVASSNGLSFGPQKAGTAKSPIGQAPHVLQNTKSTFGVVYGSFSGGQL
ncbi:Hypothetical protein PBC10988_27590 [Planctomycetales bacterium 10988]|nr:Hypothetical protein PBC10988_27590 [Planctomycetales bacterium 10988]